MTKPIAAGPTPETVEIVAARTMTEAVSTTVNRPNATSRPHAR